MAKTKAVETNAAKTEAVETEAVETEAAKTEAVETEVVETEAVNAEAVETNVAKTEKIFIHFDDTHKRPLYVCVNGRSMSIERGKVVEIPVEFAEVVKNAIQQETEAVRYSDMMGYKAD